MNQDLMTELGRGAGEKLKQGVQRLAKAGNDPLILGSALISLHGALEDGVRVCLAANPNIPSDQKSAVLDRQKAQWLQLLDLLQQYSGLADVDRKKITYANNLRQNFAHGDEYRGTRAEVEEYAEFVQRFLQNQEALAGHHAQGLQAPFDEMLQTISLVDDYRTKQSMYKQAVETAIRQRNTAGALNATSLIADYQTKQALYTQAAKSAIEFKDLKDALQATSLIEDYHTKQSFYKQSAQSAIQNAFIDCALESTELISDYHTKQSLYKQIAQAAIRHGDSQTHLEP